MKYWPKYDIFVAKFDFLAYFLEFFLEIVPFLAHFSTRKSKISLVKIQQIHLRGFWIKSTLKIYFFLANFPPSLQFIKYPLN